MSQYLRPGQRDATLARWSDGFEIISAETATEAEPAYIIPTGETTLVRTYVAYDGTVTDPDLRLWAYVNGTWYAGPTCADALTGSNEYRDWDVQGMTYVGFTVDAISGGGSVTVVAEAVD